MLMEWLRKAPTVVLITIIIVCGVITLGVLAAFVILSIQGVDTAELRQWIQTVGILLVTTMTGGTLATGLVSARSSSRAEDNTNGNLTRKDDRIEALDARVAAQAAMIERLQGGKRE